MTTKQTKTAIVILAAGASMRLGQPKQLLPFQDQLLLDYIIDECLSFSAENIFVVLGANKEKIENSSQCLAEVKVLINENWKDGLSSSIALATEKLALQYEQIIFVLGDQLFFTSDILRQLIFQKTHSKADIIFSKYQEGQGPPILFDKKTFEDLKNLKGDIGAKELIFSDIYSTASIRFEKGNLDVDTKEDLYLLEN